MSLVIQYQPSYKEEWDQYVLNHELGTFFHLSHWLTIFKEFYKYQTYYYLYIEKDKIEGVLPLARVKSFLFSDALISIPFSTSGGILADNNAVYEILLKKAISLGEELNVDYIELRNKENKKNKSNQNIYYNFEKKILGSINDNLLHIPRKQRAVVRKSEKKELHSYFTHDLNVFYHLYCLSYKNHGTPVQSIKYFQKLKKKFGDKIKVLIVEKECQPLSAVIFFEFKKTIMPYYSGSTKASRLYYANDFMYWKLYEYAITNKFEIFDFGRSKIGTGSYNYKKNWGFLEKRLEYTYYPIKSKEIPNINPLNKKYKILIMFWKKIPVCIAKVIGPKIACKIG